jgi:hypothetical protein
MCQKVQVGLKLNGTHQPLADGKEIIYIDTTKRNTKILTGGSTEDSLEVNALKIIYMLLFDY